VLGDLSSRVCLGHGCLGVSGDRKRGGKDVTKGGGSGMMCEGC
jgi:hypothetical protein